MSLDAKNLITGIVGLAWFGSYILRSIKPDLEWGMAPDALMTTVVGWWFNEKRKASAAEEE